VTSIVVTLRWGGESRDAEGLANEVRTAMERASVAGGRLVGVGADGASFAFEDGATEEAIELAVSIAQQLWRVGIGVGDLAAVRAEDAFERLSVGSAAQRAVALARTASPGEVLVDLALNEAAAGALLSTGRRVASLGDDGGKRIRALVLDLHEPWRRAGEASLEHVHVPRVVGRESSIAMIEAVEPGGLAVIRAAPGVGGSRLLEEVASRAARALLVEPTMCSVEPLGALRVALSRAQQDRARELGPRENELLDALLLGHGLEVATASDLIRAWIGGGFGATIDERAWILVDDATLVDRATLDAIGHAASVPGASFAVIARIDQGDVVPQPLGTLVVEADLSLKGLQPHEATVVLEEACGGASSVSPEVVKRWARRGAGIPLAIIESLRHGLTVGDLAVRSGLTGTSIVARSKASGRGRALSAHAWIARRLAVLESDRAHDALVAAIVALAGPGTPRAVVEEAAVDLGVPGGDAFSDAVERLVREVVLSARGTQLSPSSRTMRDATIDRIEDGTRRRIHAALSGALARHALGLDLAEGAHHAALAGDQLGAASLAVRAAERARKAGLDEWASSFEQFARTQGAPAPTPTTPSPAPRPSIPSPQPPAIESLAPDELEVVEELDEEEEEPPSTIKTPPPPPEPPVPARLNLTTRGNSLRAGYLTTGQIAALPAPYQPPADLFAAAREKFGTDDEDEQIIIDEMPPSSAPGESSGVDELAAAARMALLGRDYVALDSALSAIEVVAGPGAAVTRMRAIAALARGKVAEGLELARRAAAEARSDASRARSKLALAVALGVAGDREAALVEAVTALSSERKRAANGAGDTACRKLIERIAGVDPPPLSSPGP